MLSGIDPDGSRTAQQIIIQTILLQLVALFPYLIRLLGPVYLVGSIVLGFYFLRPGIIFAKTKDVKDAKKVMADYKISGLPVVENDKLVGIITNRDIRFDLVFRRLNREILNIMPSDLLKRFPVIVILGFC